MKRPSALLVTILFPVTLLGTLPPFARGQESRPDDPWTLLKAVKTTSQGGATFTPQPDGSLLVSGSSAEKDVYTLDFETTLPLITALRLEALADETLPHQGPGRASNGNFVLSEMRVSWTLKSADRLKPVALQNATADFVEATRSANHVLDGIEDQPGNGWAVNGAFGKDHHLVVETKKDVVLEGPGRIQLELVFNWGQKHTLGRLRFAATGQARPVKAAVPGGEETWGKLQERINLAIDRGCAYLATQQQIDGSWNQEQWTYRNGCTGLATYALLKSGFAPAHPAILRALEFMRCVTPRETYSLGCELLALSSLNDPAVQPWMEELANILLTFQHDDGFNYPWGNVDLSNTQYGTLGLRAAALHGVKIPAEVWERLAQQVLRFDEPATASAYSPLGFRYNAGTKATGSITVAGTLILTICDEQLKGRSKGGGYLAAARRGVEWLALNWSVEQNPKEAVDRWDLYFLYGVERVGSLLKIEEVGNHDWYKEGAKFLVDTQGAKGEWTTSYGEPVINTCFALLFLDRATSPVSGRGPRRSKSYGEDDPKQAVSLHASGDTPLTLWIGAFGDKELASYEWSKEAGRGLRVKRVEYFARGIQGMPGPVLLTTINKDGAEPSGRERFPAQWSFRLPGKYTLHARVTVLEPPPREGDAPREVLIESPPLEVTIDEAVDAELLSYSQDPGRNLLAGQKVVANASSKLNDSWPPAQAVDQLQCRGWLAEVKDPQPTLTLDLEKPVRATTVLLTPIVDGDDKFTCRVRRIAVTVNGKVPPIEVVCPAGETLRKIRVRLPQALIVRKVEIRILERDPAADGKAVGFNEVELQADKGGGEK